MTDTNLSSTPLLTCIVGGAEDGGRRGATAPVVDGPHLNADVGGRAQPREALLQVSR